MPRPFRPLIALSVLALACDSTPSAPPEATDVIGPAPGQTSQTAGETASGVPTELARPAAPAADTDTGKALAALVEREAWLIERTSGDEKQGWRNHQELAQNATQRAALLGDWSLYRQAEEALAAGFEQAPEGGGPFEARASLELSLHRLAPAEAAALAIEGGVIVQPDARSRAAQIRGSVALQRGDLDAAREQFTRAHQFSPSINTLLLRSDLAFKTGDADEARKLIDEALTLTSERKPIQLASTLLRRGIIELETNNLDAALDYFEKANAAYTGWYLIEEHIAEVTALKGDLAGARAKYEDIIRRTQRGEFMSALADVLEEQGETAQAKQWRALAAKAFDRDMKAYPQAAWGHALDFFLEHDTPERAAEIARANADARPWCEAKLGLAEALVLNRKLDEAKTLVDGCLSSAWETPDLRVTAAHVYKELGDLDTARKHAARAEKLAKGSADDLGLGK